MAVGPSEVGEPREEGSEVQGAQACKLVGGNSLARNERVVIQEEGVTSEALEFK